jgi:hypothetical protein
MMKKLGKYVRKKKLEVNDGVQQEKEEEWREWVKLGRK